METLMVDRVHSSLRLFMYRNAIFLCERLCAQFPSEVAPFYPCSLTRLVRLDSVYCAWEWYIWGSDQACGSDLSAGLTSVV
jgi:hypothetical protein